MPKTSKLKADKMPKADKKPKGGKKKDKKRSGTAEQSPFKTKKSKRGKWPVYVKESPRHGLGLYAARKIKADALILPLEGKRAKKDGIYVLWSVDGSEGLEVTNEAKYVNHSSKPNAAYFEDGVWALRDIRKDEEITHHYGEAWDDIE